MREQEPRPESQASSTTSATGAAQAAGGTRDALRDSLRGASYEEGRRRLSPRPEGESATPTRAYTVVRGDTLSAIALRFRVPGGYRALARDNGIPDPDRIFVGQVLRVPDPEASPAAATPSAPSAAPATATPAPEVAAQAASVGPSPLPATPAREAASGPETALAEDPAERQQLQTFMTTEHVAQNQALGGYGNFDLTYTPRSGLAQVVVRVAFEFVSGPVSERLSSILRGADPAEFVWSREDRINFRRTFIAQVHEVWSGRHPMRCTRSDSTLNHSPAWADLVANADVHIVPVDANPHFTVRVQRIPPEEFRTSSVRAPRRDASGAPTAPGLVELDSNDVTGVRKSGTSAGTTQRAGVHEFGHMIGLQDEYAGRGRRAGSTTRQGSTVGGDQDRIMAGGEVVQQAHYTSIKQALNAATAPIPFDFA